MMSKKQPDIIDAKLTNMFFFRDKEAEVGPLVKHISFFDFFKVNNQCLFNFNFHMIISGAIFV